MKKHKCIICNDSNVTPLYDLLFKLNNSIVIRNYLKCGFCKCIFVDDAEMRNDLSRLYEDDYYVFKDNAGLINRAEEDFNKYILPYKDRYASLLEIGCAKGHLLVLARKNGWTVTGLEISAAASNYAREMFNLDVLTGTVENAGLSGKQFDLIIGFDVIEHVEDPIRFLSSVKSLLNKGGTIIIDSPNPESLYSKITNSGWVGFNPFHIQMFGFKSWHVAAKKSGLKIIDIKTDHYDFAATEERWRLAKFFHIKGFHRIMNYIDNIIPKYFLKTILEKKLGDQWLIKLQSDN